MCERVKVPSKCHICNVGNKFIKFELQIQEVQKLNYVRQCLQKLAIKNSEYCWAYAKGGKASLNEGIQAIYFIAVAFEFLLKSEPKDATFKFKIIKNKLVSDVHG